MDVTIALIGLRGTALALSLQGQQQAADHLYLLADSIEAGRHVEARMAIIAEKLKRENSTSADWSDVTARIAMHSDQLQGD